MVINNVELDFDVFDVNTFTKYEAACERMDNTLKETGRKVLAKEMSASAGARLECGAVKRLFDEIFGDRAGEEVCGKSDNLKTCLEAYRTLLNEEVRQAKEQEDLNADILRLRGLTDEQIKLNSQKTDAALRLQGGICGPPIERQKIEEIMQDVTSPTGSIAPKFRKLSGPVEE